MKSIRYRTLFVAALLALVMSAVAVAAAASGLSGTYKATIKTPAQLKGTWSLALAKGGKYTVSVNGQSAARGTYSSTATTITFTHEQGSGCTGRGTYAWKKSGKTVTFTKKRESASCQARAAVLAHRFTRVG